MRRLQRAPLTEVLVQLVLLRRKGMHKLSIINKIQPYVIRRNSNVCKLVRNSKGSNKHVHNSKDNNKHVRNNKGSNKLVHNSKGNSLGLPAVVVAQQVAVVSIADNHYRITFNNAWY